MQPETTERHRYQNIKKQQKSLLSVANGQGKEKSDKVLMRNPELLHHGGPCRQSHPPVEALGCPSPHCKAGSQCSLICLQQLEQQSRRPSPSPLLSCRLRGPSDLPTAASAKSQDLPDPIPQQSTKAASPCLSTSGTTRPRGLSSTPRRSHSENRHTGDIPSAPAGGTRED